MMGYYKYCFIENFKDAWEMLVPYEDQRWGMKGETCPLVHSQLPPSSPPQLDLLTSLVKVNQLNAGDPSGHNDIVNLIL